jgi:SpoVK/Ycf46/Vps4 family AAA+-type ATPase
MAQKTNTFATFNAVGNREELDNAIYNISPEETPLVSSIGKGKAESVSPDWQTDELAAAINNKVEQGNEANVQAVTPTARVGNRTQISEKTFGVTGTQEVVDKAGRKSEVAYQTAKKMVELKRDIELAAINNGTAIAAASGVAPQARGLAGWLATNSLQGATGAAPNPVTNVAPTDGTLRPFTEGLLKSGMQAAWEKGGNPTLLFVPSALRATVSDFTGSADKFEKAESKVTTATVEVYIGDFGRLKIVNSRYNRARDVFAIEPERFKLLTLRPMKRHALAKTGDSENYMINTEWTLKSEQEAASFALRDLQPA